MEEHHKRLGASEERGPDDSLALDILPELLALAMVQGPC